TARDLQRGVFVSGRADRDVEAVFPQVADSHGTDYAVADSRQASLDRDRAGRDGAPGVYVGRSGNLVDRGEPRLPSRRFPVDVDARRDGWRALVRGWSVDELESVDRLWPGCPVGEMVLAPADLEGRHSLKFETGHCRSGGQPG